ncbi:hypothetical protein [Nonomuraea sp. 10N515B]|uniref:hypothetical protein n=1 Tax=Nonomuraea sp. 10N515B TaxID=3457422 RepID=UPI003FCE73C9
MAISPDPYDVREDYVYPRQRLSVSTAAKAYRLLRAVLMTAVEEDKLIARNPRRIKGADNEHTPERALRELMSASSLALDSAGWSGQGSPGYGSG